jgi:thiol-disulfide isomerase/thioredoxin
MMDSQRLANIRVVMAVVALIGAWVVFLIFYGPKRPPGDLSPPALSAPRGTFQADYDWSLTDRDGRTLSLAEFRGRPIFLNVWATWCGPCVAELPAIERLAFLAVSTEPLETIRAFAQEKKLTVPVYQGADPPPPIFQTEGIPATFLIAPDGRIATAQVGSTQWDDPSVVAFLEKLVAQP